MEMYRDLQDDMREVRTNSSSPRRSVSSVSAPLSSLSQTRRSPTVMQHHSTLNGVAPEVISTKAAREGTSSGAYLEQVRRAYYVDPAPVLIRHALYLIMVNNHVSS